MLGRDGDRLAESQAEGVQGPVVALTALGLVGQQDHRLARLAQQLAEHLVHGGDALSGIHHEEDQIGLFHGELGLLAHPRLQALVGDVLEAGGVDQLKVDVAQPTRGELAVSGDPGQVIDNGELPPGQPVEEGGLAHIRTADDGDFERHRRPLARWNRTWPP